VFWYLHSLSFFCVDLLNCATASLYDNARSRVYCNKARDVIEWHNSPINTSMQLHPEEWDVSGVSPFNLFCKLHRDDNGRGLGVVIPGYYCCYYYYFSSSRPPDIKEFVHRDPECGALQCLCERWVLPLLFLLCLCIYINIFIYIYFFLFLIHLFINIYIYKLK